MKLSVKKLAKFGWDVENVKSAEATLARRDYNENQAGDDCPVCGEAGGVALVVVYLRTTTGILGSGAHAGFVTHAHVGCLTLGLRREYLRAEVKAYEPCGSEKLTQGEAFGLAQEREHENYQLIRCAAGEQAFAAFVRP